MLLSHSPRGLITLVCSTEPLSSRLTKSPAAVGGKTGESIVDCRPHSKPTLQTSHRVVMPAHAQSSHVGNKMILHEPRTLPMNSHLSPMHNYMYSCYKIRLNSYYTNHCVSHASLIFRYNLSTSGGMSSVHANHVLHAFSAARIDSCNSLPSSV